MGFIRDRLPVSSPFQTEGYPDRTDLAEKSIIVIKSVLPISPINIESCSPLVIRTVSCPTGICYFLSRFCTSLGVQGILLLLGAQCLTDLDLQSLLLAFLDKLRGQRLEPRVT